jgi:UDP-N-acetyl-D-glucosamine dehydrogenase
MKVSIIGQGYVGLTISAFAGEFYQVVGFDSNEKIVEQLNWHCVHRSRAGYTLITCKLM